jgi:Tfp pilus assembly protein PilF
MIGKRKWTKWLALLVVCGVLLFACGTLILGPRVGSEQDSEEAGPADDGDTGLHRGQVLEAIEHTQAAFEGNPDDAETRLQLATLLYQAGSFPEAQEMLLPLLDVPEPSPRAMRLMAELDYLAGDYAGAERMLNRVIESAPDDFPAQLEARTRLMHVYYQTNQYAEAADLFPDQVYQPSLAVAMQAFQGQTPYQITWHSEEHRTAVPFVVTDPLPVLPIEVEGKRVYVLLDTGGATLILDHGLADKLGVRPVDAGVADFTADTGGVYTIGQVGSVRIGDVTLENVPVMTLPVKEFTFGLLGGIMGTNVLQQFLPTIDYPDGQLILREKSEQGRRAFQDEIAGREAVEVPFYLADTHYMMAKGTLNGKDDLTFFVDSGLAAAEAFEASSQTLEFTGIPIPEPAACTGFCVSASGGGIEISTDGTATAGSFATERLGLGPLIQEGHTGLYEADARGFQQLGFIVDGLISHQYLKQYAWTLDFTEMQMIFVPSP